MIEPDSSPSPASAKLERTIWLLVSAAPGGCLNVYDGDAARYDPRTTEIVTTRNESDRVTEFRARSRLENGGPWEQTKKDGPR